VVQHDRWQCCKHETDSRTNELAELKPRTNLEVRANCFSVRVVDARNAISGDTKMAINLHQFKRLYKGPQEQPRWELKETWRRERWEKTTGYELMVFTVGLIGLPDPTTSIPSSKYKSCLGGGVSAGHPREREGATDHGWGVERSERDDSRVA
jgi:hypothetical protein